MIYQVELAPETNQVHIQGYVYYEGARAFSAVAKLFDERAHWTAARGTPAQNRAYCSKEETALAGPWELGDAPHQGVATETLAAIDAIKHGQSIRTVALEHSAAFVYHERGLCALSRVIIEDAPAFRALTVVWYWGPTGSGKTRRCHAEAPDLYSVEDDGLWWDEYLNQDVILFDEFYGSIQMKKMLRWLDGYRCRLPVKGGFVDAHWTKVFITSNVDPRGKHATADGEEWNIYPKVPEPVRDAFFRRVTDIEEMSGSCSSPAVANE